MLLSNLTAISPVDGRYRKVTERLADYFSEYALIRYRVRVEVEYFIALCELPLPELKGIDTTAFERLRGLYRDFSTADAERVKEIERTTNHDVKAVEYLLKEKMDALGLGACKEFVHFGLTSQDINNTAIPLSIKEALAEVCYPALAELREKLAALAAEWHAVPMLAHTHGQPASPTRLGKELMVFVERRDGQFQRPPRRLPRRRLDRVRQPFRREYTGADPLAVHHPDRALRQSGGAVRRAQTHRHHSHRPLPRHVDLYFDGVFQAAHQGRRGRFERHAP